MAHPRVVKGDFIVKGPDNRDLISFIGGVLTVHDLALVRTLTAGADSVVTLSGLPTEDPGVEGALYEGEGGVVTVSHPE